MGWSHTDSHAQDRAPPGERVCSPAQYRHAGLCCPGLPQEPSCSDLVALAGLFIPPLLPGHLQPCPVRQLMEGDTLQTASRQPPRGKVRPLEEMHVWPYP